MPNIFLKEGRLVGWVKVNLIDTYQGECMWCLAEISRMWGEVINSIDRWEPLIESLNNSDIIYLKLTLLKLFHKVLPYLFNPHNIISYSLNPLLSFKTYCCLMFNFLCFTFISGYEVGSLDGELRIRVKRHAKFENWDSWDS